MRRTLLIITALLGVALVSNAQMLWKVTGNGMKQPSYIFGTHHLAPVTVLETTPGFADAFNNAEVVYGEVVIDDLTSLATQMKAAQMAMAPADSTLSKVLAPAMLARLDSIFRDSGLPVTAAQFDMMKPAMVNNMVTVVLGQKAFPDFNVTEQLDARVQSMARETGKEVRGLESVDVQLAALFGTPVAKQAEDLTDMLTDLDKAVMMTRTLAEAYMAADLQKLSDMLSDPDNGLEDEDARRLLVDRNNAWVELLMGVLPTASALVVVGAGHLPGDEGLINKLRKAGYAVTAVN